ncbi:Cortactin-binding protein 2 [Actinoplanes sp. SE50]|uniref:Cortactin-binding protein 2 n=1 Tax=unclassified Actinoplanes TaxID=2626549 RepID=UPI00023EC3AE|nr:MULTISPECIES: Cortactin-binding protein 2 [unclassified Actinoplanes]AEV81361.1 Cortactin-binding protein 2 [Actinoplanes sp. SE50/110]ATO79764.1 Cortactin-binding protein 2 [Actinoplanes sp. SE50]SLL97167.1 Cortactin-binding protein 2 [Actinoplanes sp. SE50/110]
MTTGPATAPRFSAVRLHQVIATQAAVVLLLIGAAAGGLVLISAAAGAAALLTMTWLRVRGRWAFQWLAADWRFRARRRAGATMLELAAPGAQVTSIALPRGPAAVLADEFGLTMLLELGDPAGPLAEPRSGLAAPWELLRDAQQRPPSRIQLLLTAAPVTAGPGPVASSYRMLTGGATLGYTRTVLAVRVLRTDGWTEGELRQALRGQARKLASRLRARPLPQAAAVRALADLTYADPAAEVQEQWPVLRAGPLSQVTFQARPRADVAPSAGLLTRLLQLPVTATTVTVTADLPEPESSEPPRISLSVRLTAPDRAALESAAQTLTRLARAERIELRRRDGEHLHGLTATLPLALPGDSAVLTGDPLDLALLPVRHSDSLHPAPAAPGTTHHAPDPTSAAAPGTTHHAPDTASAAPGTTRSALAPAPVSPSTTGFRRDPGLRGEKPAPSADTVQPEPFRSRSPRRRRGLVDPRLKPTMRRGAVTHPRPSAPLHPPAPEPSDGESEPRPSITSEQFGRLTLPTGSSGVAVGQDRHGKPVLIPLFRPAPTRVLVVGGFRCAQLLAFRAMAVGAQVLVRTLRPGDWTAFARATASPGVAIGIVPPDRPVDLPLASPLRPILTILDVDPLPAPGPHPGGHSPGPGRPSPSPSPRPSPRPRPQPAVTHPVVATSSVTTPAPTTPATPGTATPATAASATATSVTAGVYALGTGAPGDGGHIATTGDDPPGRDTADQTDDDTDRWLECMQDSGPWEATLMLRREFAASDGRTATDADLVLLQPLRADEAERAGDALPLGDAARLLSRMRSGMIGIAGPHGIRWAMLAPTAIEKVLIGDLTRRNI